ncbi:hypothetical protein [Limnohabitans sp.]|uniref:hypothetical protein n=1 Tax=Limnohabitans sp. TaxID=1907725 RepID=UPI00286F8E69|nr:hypothetical protein [Limnohabitans sp.]
MNHPLKNYRYDLATIATWAMFSRGLEPDFSNAVHEQLEHLKSPAQDNDRNIRDLTALLWCSIDNDDSRDLDQHDRVGLHLSTNFLHAARAAQQQSDLAQSERDSFGTD